MSSRMEKYNSVDYSNMSRLKKNESTYGNNDISELSRIKTNNNVSVISNAHKEIDINKIRRYLKENSLEEKEDRRISLELPKEEEVTVVRKEEKNYDINSVLEKAKDNRETNYEEDRHRKINDTQIDILKTIRIKEEEQDDDEDITGPIEELNTEEKTLVELLSNIKNHGKESQKDLFDELMGEEGDTIVAPIGDEIEKESFKEELLDMTQDLERIKLPANEYTQEINIELEKLKISTKKNEEDELEDNEEELNDNDNVKKVDKSFYTNSITFDKSDFEGLEDVEEESNKTGFFTKFLIFMIILLLICTILMIVNYVFDLNLIDIIKEKFNL